MSYWMITACIGLVLGYITQKKIAEESFLDDREGFLVHWSGQMALVIASFVLRENSLWLLVLLSSLCFCPIAWSEIRKQIFIHNFENKKIYFLDFIILQMKSGLSLRESLKKLTQSAKSSMFKTLQVLSDRLSVDGQDQPPSDFPSQVERFFNEIEIIDRNPSKKLENLIKLRAQYRMISGFTQKAAAAVSQSQAQSMVVLVLYMAATIYSLRLDESFRSHPGFLLSIFMFTVGFFWLFRLGKSLRWKT